jgi:uncharacterized protein (TIGR00269 family)
MINYEDKIAIGVSGGKDSLSLLLVLNHIFERKKTNNIIAITIDEGITGYRNESLRIVKDFCSKLGIKNETFSYKELFGIDMDESMLLRPSEKMTSCSICGTFRRRAIDVAADFVGANVIATGHNLDDHLQSFMINIIAGDVNRIGWIYPEPVYYGKNQIKKIKPFIEIYEREIVFYALQQNIPFQSEQCPYQDESIRSEIREFFNSLEETRSGVKYNTYNSLLKISKILKKYDSSVKNKCTVCGLDSTRSVCSVCKNIQILKNDL